MRQDVQQELVAVYNRSGALNPEDVLDAAQHKKSALHSQFQWNNSEAAHQYRLQQARQLIRVAVTVIPALSNEPVKQFVSIRALRRSDEGSYISTVDLLSDSEKYELAMQDALRDLERLHRRYNYLSELMPVWNAIDRATAKVRRAA